MTRVSLVALAFALPVVVSGTAAAQRVELGAFAGYRLGGTFSEGTYGGTDFSNLELANSLSLGLHGDVNLGDIVQLGLFYAYAPTELKLKSPSQKISDVGISQLQLELLLHLGEQPATTRPFVLFFAGGTWFAADDVDDEVKSSFGIGGGTKHYFPDKNWGLRFQARWITTYLASSDSEFCDVDGTCWVTTETQYMSEFEFTGGVFYMI